jgi:hypothetical protein
MMEKKIGVSTSRQRARDIWEKNIGPIPEGCVIHHIDHDPFNNSLNNLACLLKEAHIRYHAGSETSRKRNSESNSGKNNGFYDKSHTDEAKSVMRDKALERLKDPRSHPDFDHTEYHYINDDGKEEICTSWDLRHKYGLDQGAVSRVTKGRSKHTKGWRLHFET